MAEYSKTVWKEGRKFAKTTYHWQLAVDLSFRTIYLVPFQVKCMIFPANGTGSKPVFTMGIRPLMLTQP